MVSVSTVSAIATLADRRRETEYSSTQEIAGKSFFPTKRSPAHSDTFKSNNSNIHEYLNILFYAQKSLRFEKLKGKRDHQRSMRINDQWRLILEIEGTAPKKTVRIVGIEDYH
jgi:Txe/YoeB family toxin of Txe-Axe toxin-antitoxin module